MTLFALDTNVIISHLREDQFASETARFLRRAWENRTRLSISDIVYSELYTGIYLSGDPKLEEARVQSFLAANGIEVRTSKSLKVARRAGELYAKHLRGKGAGEARILPDFLVAAQAEATSEALVTWNVVDYKPLGLRTQVLTPAEVSLDRLS